MLKRFVLASISGWLIPGWLIAGIAFAQTGGTSTGAATTGSRATGGTPTGGTSTSTPTPGSGSFASHSPGNQKIAKALFDAQKTPTPNAGPTGSTTLASGTATEPTPLTLDQIAQMKQSGQGGGNVFREMKSQGIIEAKNLGSVVSASNKHQTDTVSGGGTAGTDGATNDSTTATGSATATTTHGAGKKSGSTDRRRRRARRRAPATPRRRRAVTSPRAVSCRLGRGARMTAL